MTRHELTSNSITCLVGIFLLAPFAAIAQPDEQANTVSDEAVTSVAAARDWQPVSAETLDASRGGFTTPSGLELSLGIDRLVTINGNVVAHTMLQLGDISAVKGDPNTAVRDTLAVGKIIQNGPNNFYMGSLDQTVAGTVVQNTLNDQVIRSQTTITSTINSLSLLKDLNFQTTLRDAAISAIGPK